MALTEKYFRFEDTRYLAAIKKPRKTDKYYYNDIDNDITRVLAYF